MTISIDGAWVAVNKVTIASEAVDNHPKMQQGVSLQLHHFLITQNATKEIIDCMYKLQWP